jgi:hypothetical protein
LTNRSRARIDRLDHHERDQARLARLQHVRMNDVLREIFAYVVYVWIIYLITYSNRNDHAFLQVNHLRHYLLHRGHPRQDFTQVSITDRSIDRP